MPKHSNTRRDSSIQFYDEYDARAYVHVTQSDKRILSSHSIYDDEPPTLLPQTSRETKSKKSKKKKSKKKKDGSSKSEIPLVKPLVAYDDISSESDISRDDSRMPVLTRVELDRGSKRTLSPGTEIRSAIVNQRGHSSSPTSSKSTRRKSKSKSKRSRHKADCQMPQPFREQSYKDECYDDRDSERHDGKYFNSSRQRSNFYGSNTYRSHPTHYISSGEHSIIPRSFTMLPRPYSSRPFSPSRQFGRHRDFSTGYRDGRKDRSRSPLEEPRASSSRFCFYYVLLIVYIVVKIYNCYFSCDLLSECCIFPYFNY